MESTLDKIKKNIVANRWSMLIWFLIGLFIISFKAGTIMQDQQKAQLAKTPEIVVVESEKPVTTPEPKPVQTEDKTKVVEAVKPPVQEKMKWPGQGEVITGFGFSYSKTFEDQRFHKGIDIALPQGYEVRAALSGKVTEMTNTQEWGYTIGIEHGNGLITKYKGIKPLRIQSGYQVEQGEVIAVVTASPRYEAAMPSHLHFEVWLNGKAVDPGEYLNK